MSIFGRGIAVGLAALAALPAAAAARATVVPSSTDRSVTVPPRGARSLTLTCPRTAVALHAAAVRLPGGVRVADSVPGKDARRWTIRFASVARGARKARATLRCVRLRLPSGVSGVTVGVSTGSRPHVRVAARSSEEVTLRCPPGYVPTGQGVGAGTRGVSLTAAVPDDRGWVFRIDNRGESAAHASARIRCLERVVSGRRAGKRTALAFGLKRVAFQVPIAGGGRSSFKGSCARGRFSVATGFQVGGPGRTTLLRSFPFGARNASWTFANRGVAGTATGYLTCLSRSSRFR